MPLNLCLACMKQIATGQSVCPYCKAQVPCSPNPEDCLQPGYHLPKSTGRYVIGRVIGRGGFGITYIAFDTLLRVTRCIKEFFPQSFKRREDMSPEIEPGQKERFKKYSDLFLKEARIISQLSIKKVPNVAEVYDQLEENSTNYIVMEYLDGCTMDEYISRHGGLGWEEAKNVMTSVLETLSVIHHLGCLHRDISLNNIFRLKDGSVRVIDFGNAELINRAKNHPELIYHTSKKYYSPPEQINQGPQQQWTDVYAAGICMFKLVAGRFPESSENGQAVPLLRALGYKVAPEFDAVIRKATQQDPGKRYPTAAAMLEDVRKIPPPPPPRPKLLPWIIACAAVSLIGLFIFILTQSLKTEPKPDPETTSQPEKTRSGWVEVTAIPTAASTSAERLPTFVPNVSMMVSGDVRNGRTYGLKCHVKVLVPKKTIPEAWIVRKTDGGNAPVKQLTLTEFTPAEKDIPKGFSAEQVQGWELTNENGLIDLTSEPNGEYTLMIRVPENSAYDVSIGEYLGEYITVDRHLTEVPNQQAPNHDDGPTVGNRGDTPPLSTPVPTQAPTRTPTQAPTRMPTQTPTQAPTRTPTQAPTRTPTQAPTQAPTRTPTQAPTRTPTQVPTRTPTQAPTQVSTQAPMEYSRSTPAWTPTPTPGPTEYPRSTPTWAPTPYEQTYSSTDEFSFSYSIEMLDDEQFFIHLDGPDGFSYDQIVDLMDDDWYFDLLEALMNEDILSSPQEDAP